MATSGRHRHRPPDVTYASAPVCNPEQARGDDRDDACRGELPRQTLLPADPDQPGQVLGERAPNQVAIQPGALAVVEPGRELRESQEMPVEAPHRKAAQLRRPRERYVAEVLDGPQLALEVRVDEDARVRERALAGT